MANVRSQKQKSVQQHDYAMSPAPDVPRSVFNLSHGRKMPFNFSDLVPILCEFVLPGDTWNCTFDMAARTAVPIVPLQDNWRVTFFSFFVPMRLVWANSHKFWGEQETPGASIDYLIPQQTSPVGGYSIGNLADLFGLPCGSQIPGGNSITVNTLPFRCYNKIWNDWFRDENLQNPAANHTGDGPDDVTDFPIRQRGKRFDLITQALPWPQKGNTAISLPIGSLAPVKTHSTDQFTGTGRTPLRFRQVSDGGYPGAGHLMTAVTTATGVFASSSTAAGTVGTQQFYPANLYADLTAATGTTLNAFRTAVAMQQYLERDARMGTRYTEFVWGMFRVRTADARLQRPEFIGGGGAEINTTPIAQTSATGITGGTTPTGNLAASGYGQGGGSFTYSATEHGYIITLACGTTDITYQQGTRRMWSVRTRYDFPVPLLANLGEQAMYNREIYTDGSATDDNVFGYVPRWDEYRSIPSQIVGIYRSTTSGTLDYWHSSQRFATLPTLNSTFIADDSKTVVQRNFAAGATTLGQQILADFYFNIRCARALPLYGIPGLTRL